MKTFDRILNILLIIGISILILLSFQSKDNTCNHEPYEYTLVCSDDGYYISSDDRPVGFIPLGDTALDSIMIDDNQ